MKLALIGILLASSLSGWSQISIGTRALEVRLADADVVCVGSVEQSRGQVPTIAGQPFSRNYNITSLRVYKGGQSGEAIDIGSEAGQAPLPIGGRYLFFMNHQAHVSHVLIATFFSVPDDFPLNQTLVDPPSLEDDIDAYLISQSWKADTPQVEAMLKLLGLYQTFSPVSQHVLTSFTESAAPRAALLSTYILLWKHIDATRLAPL